MPQILLETALQFALWYENGSSEADHAQLAVSDHSPDGRATDQTLMALFGWMSPKMIERYSHVREEAKMRAVKVFDNPESLEGPPKNHHSEGASTDKPYVN
jgi:hypothetical protein